MFPFNFSIVYLPNQSKVKNQNTRRPENRIYFLSPKYLHTLKKENSTCFDEIKINKTFQ